MSWPSPVNPDRAEHKTRNRSRRTTTTHTHSKNQETPTRPLTAIAGRRSRESPSLPTAAAAGEEYSENVLIGQACGRNTRSQAPGRRSSRPWWHACTHSSDTASARPSPSACRAARAPPRAPLPTPFPPPPSMLPSPPTLKSHDDARLVHGQQPCSPTTRTAPRRPKLGMGPELEEAPVVVAANDRLDEDGDDDEDKIDGTGGASAVTPAPESSSSTTLGSAWGAASGAARDTPAAWRARRTREALLVSSGARQRPPCLLAAGRYIPQTCVWWGTWSD